MKRKTYYIIFPIIILLVCNSYAQHTSIKKANADYDNFSYVKTSDLLLEVANNGYRSVDLFQKLGNSFYFNNKMNEAAKWYGELLTMDDVKLNDNIDPEYYYRYAQSLKAIEEYKESDKWMQKFSESTQNDKRASNFKSSPNYLKMIDLLSEDIEIINLNKIDFTGKIIYLLILSYQILDQLNLKIN